MARNIDLTQPLTQEDLEYIDQRPWLRADYELSGGVIVEAEAEEDDSYESLNVEELKAEIAERNEDREDDDKIVVGGKGNKPDLIAALEADDEAADE